MKGAYSFKMRATAFVVAVLFVISIFINIKAAKLSSH
jgi:preprotein translocase subunit SecG